MSALDPDRKDREGSESRERNPALVLVQSDPSPEPERVSTIDEEMRERSMPDVCRPDSESDRDADPVWTWNVPDYITGDSYGIGHEVVKRPSKEVQAQERMLAEKIAGESGKACPYQKLYPADLES